MQTRTRRQKEVLEIITRYIKNHGYEPSYQQIARQLGVSSKAGIAKHIKSLEEQGLLTRRRDNGKFNLELRPEDYLTKLVCEIDWLDVPRDENPTEDWEETPLFVPRFMLGFQDEERIRAFRVTDDSMFDEHILEGDVVLIEKRGYARDGDVVVAIVGGKRAVLKKYFRDGAKVELRPANPVYDSIILSADKVSIEGVLHSVLRPAR
ncbi:MAG TPA: transcriptional repressor LexA [Pyrinomonadaceae bacterium]|jgi:repressor LexA